MDDLYIINYSYQSSTPLKSITQLPEEEAYKIAEKLYSESQCRAHRRFGPDFPVYYKHRLMTEKWLYEKFISIGGKPQTEHPFYFALHHCDNLFRNFDNGKGVKIPINDIEITDISFTFGDSVGKMDSPERRDPFLKDELIGYIQSYENDVVKFLESIEPQYTCIEAQLWTDRYFNRSK